MASNYPFVQPDAAKITGTFAKAFDLFSQCHNGYNSSHHMTDGDIDKLGKNNTKVCVCNQLMSIKYISEQRILTFMSFYRENFPHATVLHKMHIM